MIKGIGTTDKGERQVIVGLSSRNIDLLKEGKPILAKYPDGSFVIVIYGDTEKDLVEDLRALGWILPDPPSSPPQ